jgi:hypothetical protein
MSKLDSMPEKMLKTGGTMQTWTYEEITKAAEETIIDAMTEAARKADARDFHRGAACGTHALWAYLTYGKHPDWDADSERLSKLTQSK